LNYDGASNLIETLQQQQPSGVANFLAGYTLQSYQLMLGGGNQFLVGFTGGTGGLNAGQQISNFTFTPNGPQVAPATTVAIFHSGDQVVGVNTLTPGSNNPNEPNEGAAKSLDGNASTKYLNFDGPGAGIVVLPASGQKSVVTDLSLTSANDTIGRDPASYEVWGTNDSNLADINPELNPAWQTHYTLISSGAVPSFSSRFTAQDLLFANSTAFTNYLVDFPTNQGDPLFQIADVQLYGTLVPEPTSLILLVVGGLALLMRCRSSLAGLRAVDSRGD
jgi:hypothetical protein